MLTGEIIDDLTGVGLAELCMSWIGDLLQAWAAQALCPLVFRFPWIAIRLVLRKAKKRNRELFTTAFTTNPIIQ